MAGSPTSEAVLLHLADSTLAAGLRYGLWVERAPSTEEQVAVSSMSQDKLGQARQFYQLAESELGHDPVDLQQTRAPGAFEWNPAWLVPWGSWAHFVVAQTTLGRALREDIASMAEGTPVRGLLEKIEQEDSWHDRHGIGWLAQAGSDRSAREDLQGALEELWPAIVGYFGASDDERFPEAMGEGLRSRSDDETRQRFLEAIVPLLEDAGLHVAAEPTSGGWTTEPAPSTKLVERLEGSGEQTAVELVGMLQDPVGREIARL